MTFDYYIIENFISKLFNIQGYGHVFYLVILRVSVRVMVFNATFNNISVMSWWSVLLVEETGVLGENHRPVASHWQMAILSENLVIAWLSDRCLMPSEQFFSYIMVKTSYISIRWWWCPLCTRPTLKRVGFL